ncbi:MAG: DUF1192 domain-containing protein [Pseudomonadota bacterium]
MAGVDTKRNAANVVRVEDEERPVRRGAFGAASLLASDSLDSYSQEELGARITLLEAEIVRINARLREANAQRLAAESFFKPPGPATRAGDEPAAG